MQRHEQIGGSELLDECGECRPDGIARVGSVEQGDDTRDLRFYLGLLISIH